MKSLLVLIVAVVLLVPGSLLTLLIGFFFGVGEGFVMVSISSVAGASLAFLIGRYFAREWVEEKVQNFGSWSRIDLAIARRGFYIVLLTRLSPVFPFNLLNYFLGLTKIKFLHYLLASWIGMAPATLLFVYLGSVASSLTAVLVGEMVGSDWQNSLLYLGLFATLALTVLLTRIASRALKNEVEVPAE